MTSPKVINPVALDPSRSVVVSACAGSGKTWLLVSRIVRALLDGAQPSEILAITFTRKAAQEMAARLREWLFALATADDDTVRRMLREREVPESRVPILIPVARGLYERYLTAEPGITITTFHSWFMQLLRRAPLDADALGDAVLQENTAALTDEAWERFAASVQGDPDSDACRGLDYLFGQYGLENTRRVLTNFLSRRADWWAYVENAGDQRDAVTYALEQIASGMTDTPDADILGTLRRHATFAESLAQYERYLAGGVSRGRASAEKLTEARETGASDHWFDNVWRAVFNDKDEPRSYKPNKTQEAALGIEGQQKFLDLHRDIAARLAEIRERHQAQQSYRFNQAALHCGHALLEEYQSLKRDRRVIDYADIEWRTYQLLCNSDHAIYMLCKLDARYRHVLLDEFQDTNPLQWLTLQRWLESAAEVDSRPQVFLVGDPKQSIYRFRRAEARLFDQSTQYLGEHFGAPLLSQDESRRCAPVVIDVVNRLFGARSAFEGFRPHAAHHAAKPGRVELWPLIGKDDEENAASNVEWRNPFEMPLAEPEDSRRAREAELLARRILDIKREWRVAADEQGEKTRPATYGDIMILVSRRTHLDIYERALREHDIPFVTSRQGGLLDALEVQDLIALLEFLVSPFADLKLAHTLRSPVFACSDDDLITLAQAVRATPGSIWWSAFAGLPEQGLCPTLTRARRLLTQWLDRADTLPVHDQLDRIYFEADVPHRYHAAVPEAMRGAVAANLDAFMQRALDTDAGRYPSLPRFIGELADLRNAPLTEAPDEGVIGDTSDAVRIHTVHGAKGLEAPIVWLLDAASSRNNSRGYEALIDWPVGEARPVHFSMLSRKDEQSPRQRDILQHEDALAEREDLNMLYVAITRAKQALIVSGYDNNRRKNSWYEKIRAAMPDGDVSGATAGSKLVAVVMGDLLEQKKYQQKQILKRKPSEVVVADARLSQPLPTGVRRISSTDPSAHAGVRYGTLFHLLMEQLTVTPSRTREEMRRVMGLSADDAMFDALWRDAQRVLTEPALARYFDPKVYRHAQNEVPLVAESGELLRIDRLVEFADEVCVLDYKTGNPAQTDAALLAQYRQQVNLYRRHMARAFADKAVTGLLVFTDGGSIAVDDPV